VSNSPTFSNSYVFTTRATPLATSKSQISPLPGGTYWSYLGGGSYQANPAQYQTTDAAQTIPSSVVTALLADLGIAKQAGCAQLTILIHGLGVLFDEAITQLSMVGPNLQDYGNYNGLVVAFDWPSFGPDDSMAYYGDMPWQFPPLTGQGTIRSNIAGSAQAFVNFFLQLSSLAQANGFALNVICHSEGNFMTMVGMNQFTQAGTPLQNVLMVAADINDAALQLPSGNLTGEGAPIAAATSQVVTVYYSTNDDVLPGSAIALKAHHNPSYPKRLGLTGPSSYTTLSASCAGVDCSQVVWDQNQPALSTYWPQGVKSHDAYFYIPQVLADWGQTLAGTPPQDVGNRVDVPPGANHFTMTYVPPST
jgi:esterase/lipase superfamily enzyme